MANKKTSKDLDNSILENQIGELGGEPQVPSEKNGLGHLSKIPGQQAPLTDTEKNSLDAFNAKIEQVSRRSQAQAMATPLYRGGDIVGGWIPIDRTEMGTRSMFYPAEWSFKVKPADVREIKNWSAIDENSLAATNQVFNEIMKTCVSIDTPEGKKSWENINTWDRFWFVLMVRKYTFSKGEKELNYDDECDHCGQPMQIHLTPEALVYEYPDQEVIDHYWNAELRQWIIDPAEYDIPQQDKIHLYVPTLGKDDAILQWLYIQNQLERSVDEVFVKYLPWLLPRALRDASLLDKEIKECKKTFDSWNLDMFGFMEDVMRNININPDTKLKAVCPSCGEEVQSTVRFPNGVKYLFSVPGRHKQFGTK
jgi:hypothetical protein